MFVLKIPLPFTVSVEELNEEGVAVYPNPCDGKFNLNMSRFESLKIDELKVYTVYGECIYSKIPAFSNPQIDLGMHPGIYFLKLTSGNKTVVKKVVVR